MKLAAAICNLALFAFTGFLVATDGMSREVVYIAYTLLLLAIPILSVVVLLRRASKGDAMEPRARLHRPASGNTILVAMIGNLVLLGFDCWVLVNEFTHSRADAGEPGYVPFVVLVVLTPILTLAALLRDAAGQGGASLQTSR